LSSGASASSHPGYPNSAVEIAGFVEGLIYGDPDRHTVAVVTWKDSVVVHELVHEGGVAWSEIGGLFESARNLTEKLFI